MRNLTLCLKINYTSILNNKTERVHTSLSHLSLACLPNVFLYLYVHVYVCAHMYVCRSVCVCIHACAWVDVCLCVYGHVRVFKHSKYETSVTLITFLALYGFWNLCSA